MRNRQGVAIVLAALLLGGGVSSAQNYAPGSLDRYFRIEWEATRGAKGPRVAGYVNNMYGQAADGVRLLIEHLDGSGQVTGRSTTYVAGGVPSGGRAYFEARVAEAPAYRVQVLSFDWVGRGGA